MNKQFDSLQVGRGFAALIVILFHARLIATKIAPLSRFEQIFSFGSSGVDFFFVLSGFLICYVHLNDIGHPTSLWRYVRKRFTRIYPPYWVLCGLLAPWYLLIPSLVAHQGARGWPVILKSLALLPQNGTRIVGVTWSLEYE